MELVVAWARRHWLLVASVAVFALLLLLPSVWSTTVEAHTRGGMSYRVSLAQRGLWVGGAGVAMYFAAGLGHPGHWAMRPPTTGEVTVARWMMRAAGLVLVWLAVYATIP